MALTFVLDEHLRGILWPAIQQHNSGGQDLIDVVRVGDPPDLPLGTLDPDLLLWAEQNGRVLISRDWNSMPTHLANHLQAGHHSPGICFLRAGQPLSLIVFAIVVLAHTADPADLVDTIRYLP